MKRSEAYHILGKMTDYATEEQKEALSIAMHDIESIDLAQDGEYCPYCGAETDAERSGHGERV